MSVVAYRAWNVDVAGRLGAVGVVGAWEQEQVTAQCQAGNTRRFHLPPNPGCTCGVYAWRRPINPERIDQWSRRPPAEIAVGVVRLWGRMCDGEAMTGYRAQYARVVALVPDAAGRLVLARYPSVRAYPDLPTMYGDWDVSPELGWAADAALRVRNAR